MKPCSLYLFTVAALVLLVVLPQWALAQGAPPASVAGTVTVNGVPMDGVSVSGGGGSGTTHSGGKYAFDVTPGTVTVMATYQGHSSPVKFTIESGGFHMANINIDTATSTLMPGAQDAKSPGFGIIWLIAALVGAAYLTVKGEK